MIVFNKLYLNFLDGPEILPFQSQLYSLEGTKYLLIDCIVKSNPSKISLEWFKDKYLLSKGLLYLLSITNKT